MYTEAARGTTGAQHTYMYTHRSVHTHTCTHTSVRAEASCGTPRAQDSGHAEHLTWTLSLIWTYSTDPDPDPNPSPNPNPDPGAQDGCHAQRLSGVNRFSKEVAHQPSGK